MTLDAPPILATSPAGWNGALLQLPNFSVPGQGISLKQGNVLDASCYSAWSLRVVIAGGGAPVTIFPTWYEDLSETPGLFAFPNSSEGAFTFPGPGSWRVVGSVESPLLSIAVSATAATTAAFHFQLSNRPRVWEAPYTPENHGTLLASIANQSVAAGANAPPVDVPFYLGPAHYNANIDNAGNAQAHIISDGFTVELASLYTSDQTAGLWIPPAPVGLGATKWTLTAHVNTSAGGPKTIGATLVAG